MSLQPRYAPIRMTRTGHNHPPEDVDQTMFYYNLKKRAKYENKNLRAIYDEEAKRDPGLALAIPFSKVKQAMQRARRSSVEHDTSLDVSNKTENRTPVQKDQIVIISSHQSVSHGRAPVRRGLDSGNEPVGKAHPTETSERAVSNKYALVINEESVCNPPQSVSDVRVVSNRQAVETTDDAPVSSAPRSDEDVYAHVELQNIFIGPGQKVTESTIFYECPYCKRLFDNEDPLDQHIVDEHVNSLMVEEEVWDDPDNV